MRAISKTQSYFYFLAMLRELSNSVILFYLNRSLNVTVDIALILICLMKWAVWEKKLSSITRLSRPKYYSNLYEQGGDFVLSCPPLSANLLLQITRKLMPIGYDP